MDHLDLVMGRTAKQPACAHLRFEDECIVEIEREDWPAAKELIEKVGEDRFSDTDNIDFDVYRIEPFGRFITWLTDNTDLLVEHSPEHWNN